MDVFLTFFLDSPFDVQSLLWLKSNSCTVNIEKMKGFNFRKVLSLTFPEPLRTAMVDWSVLPRETGWKREQWDKERERGRRGKSKAILCTKQWCCKRMTRIRSVSRGTHETFIVWWADRWNKISRTRKETGERNAWAMKVDGFVRPA